MTPKRHLPNRTYSPPGSWRYTVPETGQHFRGYSDHQLITQVESNYRSNRLPIPPNLRELIEDFICTQEPDYCTDSHGQPFPDGKRSLYHTFQTVLQGTRTLAHWLLTDRTFVPQAQAEARARTCVPCPFNASPEGCTNCNLPAMHAAVRTLVGDRRTSLDANLRACRVCLCDLRAKVHFPHAALWQNMPADQRAMLPDECWLKQEAALTPSTPT